VDIHHLVPREDVVRDGVNRMFMDNYRYQSLLNSINFVDSSILRLSIDIAKIEIVIDPAFLNSALKDELRLDTEAITLKFLGLRDVKISLNRTTFPKLILNDGTLAAADISGFEFDRIKIISLGKTRETNCLDVYSNPKQEYAVELKLEIGVIYFCFVTLKIAKFDAASLYSEAKMVL